MFLPVTIEEARKLGWEAMDVILVAGDAYVDSPFFGIAVIGKVLLEAGYRVGMIPQPDIHSDKDIRRFGEPELFWGVSAGCLDSMISNYTPLKKFRKKDDLTAGGENDKRPDRATLVYTNLIRKYFKNTSPIVLGGIEASLRRISHYDYWSNSVRRSILFDAKADILVYGMAENTVLELADKLRRKSDISDIRGICYIGKEPPEGYVELPAHQEVIKSKTKFIDMFHTFYRNTDPVRGNGLFQKQDTRYLIQTPPPFPLTTAEMDRIHDLDFERDAHPCHRQDGPVKALETIRFSISSHRGCYGECHFCAITVHQGRTISERSESSILKEAEKLTCHPGFKGVISDIGGPSANMFGIECDIKKKKGACIDQRCLFPEICRKLPVNHEKQIRLLQKIRRLPKINHVFIASGIRYDMILKDRVSGNTYLEEILRHHTSGQLKIAPEHTEENVLELMGKPSAESLSAFKRLFEAMKRKTRKKQFLTYYLIAAHPGCHPKDMAAMCRFVRKELKITPEQLQIFTPSPSTYSTLMYYTEIDPFTGDKIFVEKNPKNKEKQKRMILDK